LAPALRHRVRAHRSRWSAHAGCLGNRVRDVACGRHCHTHPAAVRGEDASPRWAGVRTRGGWAVPPPLRAVACAPPFARGGARARASPLARTGTESSSAVHGGARAGCFGNRAFRHSRRAAPRPASGRALGAARLRVGARHGAVCPLSKQCLHRSVGDRAARAFVASFTFRWRVSAVVHVARASATSHTIAAPAAWASPVSRFRAMARAADVVLPLLTASAGCACLHARRAAASYA
jgi:hypothetical protein